MDGDVVLFEPAPTRVPPRVEVRTFATPTGGLAEVTVRVRRLQGCPGAGLDAVVQGSEDGAEWTAVGRASLRDVECDALLTVRRPPRRARLLVVSEGPEVEVGSFRCTGRPA